MAVALAVVGCVLVAMGAALIYPPAGFIVAGVSMLAASYIRRYLEAHDETSRASR